LHVFMAFTCFRHEQFIVFNVILPSFFCHTSLLLPSSSSAHTSAASRDHSLRLWDVHTHTAIACLTGTSSPLTSVHFSPSSAVVAAACADGSVRLWSTSSGAAVAALAGHTSAAACCMAWSSDEALVAAAAGDGSVGVWEAGTGLRRVVLQCPQAAAVARITLSPDARLLAAAVGAPASCVHVFDLPSSSLLASPAVRGSVEQVQWSADGRQLQDGHGDVFNAP
jgi:WD40 repeat protein